MGDATASATTPAGPMRGRRRRPVFRTLRVARTERLCEDATAITFDVPKELADEYAFAPGQTLTLRHVADGRDEPRFLVMTDLLPFASHARNHQETCH